MIQWFFKENFDFPSPLNGEKHIIIFSRVFVSHSIPLLFTNEEEEEKKTFNFKDIIAHN